jgi:hypothetical protein
VKKRGRIGLFQHKKSNHSLLVLVLAKTTVMKQSLTLLLLLFSWLFASAQDENKKPKYNISFVEPANGIDTIYRSAKSPGYWTVSLKSADVSDAAFKDHSIEIVADEGSSFKSANYEFLSTVSGKIKDLPAAKDIVIALKKEDESFKQVKPLKLTLKLAIKKPDGGNMVADAEENNAGKVKTIVLIILPADEKLPNYNYLGYLGTNFDLVDGIQAKHLFFATNIFVADTKKWGFALGLYGNRTMTKTDSTREAIFESRIEKINNDSIARYFDSATRVSTRVSDNIGINFMPLFKIGEFSEATLKVYYAPQFEFIWRRTILQNEYIGNKTVRIDSGSNRFPANTAFPLTAPLKTKLEFNVYDVYIGLAGLLVRYENDDISVRISSSVGINFNYSPTGVIDGSANASPVNSNLRKLKRAFYFGRLWITEPTTGLTLGAEVSNYFGSIKMDGSKMSKGQPFYNVTLSKAFNLKNLAGFVKPLTSR